jgi:hypothetical protein
VSEDIQLERNDVLIFLCMNAPRYFVTAPNIVFQIPCQFGHAGLCDIGQLYFSFRGGLCAHRALNDVLLARSRCADHLSDRFTERIILPGNEALAKAHSPKMDDCGEVQRMQPTKPTTFLENGGGIDVF